MEWEYQIQPLPVADDDKPFEQAEEMLNEMGSERWEVFAVVPSGVRTDTFFAFAKRPLFEKPREGS